MFTTESRGLYRHVGGGKMPPQKAWGDDFFQALGEDFLMLGKNNVDIEQCTINIFFHCNKHK